MVIELGDVAGWVAATVAMVSAFFSYKAVGRARDQVEQARRSADAARDSAETMQQQLTVAESALAESRQQRKAEDRRAVLPALQQVLSRCWALSRAVKTLLAQLEDRDFAAQDAADNYQATAQRVREELDGARRLAHGSDLVGAVRSVRDTLGALDEGLQSFLAGAGRPPDDRSRIEVREHYDNLVGAIEDLDDAVDAWSARTTNEEGDSG